MEYLKKGLAEFFGTFVLVFFACGVASLTNGQLVPTALAFGLVIIAMAYSVGRVSGCHLNPAVSLAFFCQKKIDWKEFLIYVGFQILGGFVGAVLLFSVLKMGDIESISEGIFGSYKIGDASNYPIGYSGSLAKVGAGGYIGALITEIILTLIFVYVILCVSDEDSVAGGKAGIIIGLTLTLIHLVGIKLTGTSVNPARSIATALTSAIFFSSSDALASIWIFIVGPCVGSYLAYWLHRFLHKNY